MTVYSQKQTSALATVTWLPLGHFQYPVIHFLFMEMCKAAFAPARK